MFRALFGSSSELEQVYYGTFVVNMKFQNFSPRSSSVENRALLTITYNSFGNSSECFVQVTFGKNHRKIANEILIFFLSLHFDFCSIRWCTCFFFLVAKSFSYKTLGRKYTNCEEQCLTDNIGIIKEISLR